MTDHMYSAEEAAQILGLQVRTVRNYVRDGRLPGVRIGKQYRIGRADLEAFTAGGLGEPVTAAPERAAPVLQAPGIAAEASSVVQIDGVDADAAARIERTITAARLAGESSGSRLRVEPLYDEQRRRLKFIVVGDVGETAQLLRVIELFANERG